MFGKKLKNRSRRSKSIQPGFKPMFSYYSNNSRNKASLGRHLQPDASGRLNRRQWWHNLPSIIAALVVLTSLLYVLGLDTSNPKVIQPNDASAVLLRSKSTYEQAAHKYLRSSLLNHNKITINVIGITRDMQREFPELANVSITLPLIGRRPLVYINPSIPTIILTSKNGAFILDDQGRAIIAVSQLSTQTILRLPTVTDESGIFISPGKSSLPVNDVDFITTVVRQLKHKNIDVQSIVLPSRADQLDVRIVGKTYVIKMNLQNDARQQIGTFLTAKQKLETDHQEPGEYFDVRVDERVYFK